MNEENGRRLSLLFGAGIFLYIFGFEVLNVSNISWIINGDSGYHYLGWAFFRNEDWAYPLGTISKMMYPIGTNLMQLDSIPIVAIVAKAFAFLLPKDFQYFGLWTLLCFLLQSYFGYRLCYRLTRDSYFSLLASILLVLTPAFLYRFELMHRSLGAQWLILWLLDLHYSSRSTQRITFGMGAQLLVLTVISAGVHAYLFVAHLALCLAILIDRAIQSVSKSERIRTAIWSAALLFTGYAAGHSVGYFQVKSKMSNGFGYFSMDLLAPFNSFGKSIFLMPLSANDSQYEGFVYPGLGVFLLVISALIGKTRKKTEVQWRFSLFITGVLGFFIFAMATPITLLGEPFIYLDSFYLFLQPIPSAFRASGRFAWFAMYLLVIVSLVAVARSYDKKAALALVAGVLFLQIIDLSSWISDRNSFAPKYEWQAVQTEKWEAPMSGIEEIQLIPIRYQEIGCFDGKLNPGGFSQKEYTSFALQAAFRNLRFNSGSVSRPPEQDIKSFCKKYFEDLRQGITLGKVLMVVHKDYYQEFLKLATVRPSCVEIDGIYACRH